MLGVRFCKIYTCKNPKNLALRSSCPTLMWDRQFLNCSCHTFPS